jgi:hypothetical protein
VTLQRVLAWLLAHPDVVATLATALLGTGASVRHYRRTGNLPLRTLPWRAFRRLAYRLRRHLWTVPRPAKQGFVVQDSVDAIRTRLGRESFEPGWPLSYHYHGEDLNARRYYLDPGAEYPHRQLHIRGFTLEDGAGVELLVHDEPAPKHHPRAHLREEDLADAREWLADAWPSPALDPRTFDRQQTDSS